VSPGKFHCLFFSSRSVFGQFTKISLQYAGIYATVSKQLTFWGAIDTQHVLPFGSSSDVENEVKDRISDLAAGGGFVLSAVHAIQPDVPIQNIIAMRDAALKYGSYNRVI